MSIVFFEKMELIQDITESNAICSPVESKVGSVVYEFFKKIGFKQDRFREVADIKDLYRKETSIRTNGNRVGEFIELLGLVQDRVIFYKLAEGVELDFGHTQFSPGRGKKIKCPPLTKIMEIEDNEDSIEYLSSKSNIESVANSLKEAGGNMWYGHMVFVQNFNSYYFLALEEDFSGAKKSIDEFNQFIRNNATHLYSQLDVKKTIHYFSKTMKLCKKFFANPNNAIKVSEYVDELINISRNAGIYQCDSDLNGKIKEYCSSNGLDLSSKFGPTLLRSGLLETLEEIRH